MALKHGGLSQLADTADPTHYPVKRKREPRRLNPNWAGIAWLEAQALGPTTLHDPDPMGDVPGLYIQRSSGGEQVKTSTTNYVRPMFQIFHPDASSSMRRPVDRPCAACYDFGRSWNCPAHPERKWLGVGRGWERPATPQEPTAPDFTGWADMIDPDTIARAWKAQLHLCRAFRRLGERKDNKSVVAAAVARKLAGFVWAEMTA